MTNIIKSRRIPDRLSVPKILHIPFDAPLLLLLMVHKTSQLLQDYVTCDTRSWSTRIMGSQLIAC